MSRWVPVLLWLLLGLSAWANPAGILSRIGRHHARFLQDSEVHSYTVGPELRKKLIAAGLGSTWEYGASGEVLDFAIYKGTNPQFRSALETVAQFLRRVNQQNWKEAHGMLFLARQQSISLPEFIKFWAPNAVSGDQADWQLMLVKNDMLVVSIHSTQGALYDDSVETSPRHSQCQVTVKKHEFRWLVDAYQ